MKILNLNSQTLSTDQTKQTITTLKTRFEQNPIRHPKFKWSQVETKLVANPAKLWSLFQMEQTGGEPDVVDFDTKNDEYIFYDCSPESPTGRRNLCYDQAALDGRKNFKPKDSAANLALSMGIELLTESDYLKLQQLGEFDLKTSSWLKTPDKIRNLGGAIYGDRRYDRVFIFHNGADSYYAVRGFRGLLRI